MTEDTPPTRPQRARTLSRRGQVLAFVAVSIVMAIGEMSGYVFPARRAELLKMTYNELHRELYLARMRRLIPSAPGQGKIPKSKK